MEEKTAKKILYFWFGKINNNGLPDKEKQTMWWIKDKNLDQLIKKEFEKHLNLGKILGI